MAYIGNTATTQAFTPAVDYFNGDGATVAFTLSKPVASVAQVQAVIENVPQNPGSAYTVSGNTITFTSAPPSGTANIYVYYTSPITQVIAPSQGTVGTSALQDGSVTSAKLATLTTLPAPSSNTLTLPSASGTIDRLNRAGNVLQVVHGTSLSQASTTGSTLVASNLTASIAPTSASSKILVVCSVYFRTSGAGVGVRAAIYRGVSQATAYTPFYLYGSNTALEATQVVTALDSPSTTSSTAYTLYFARTDAAGTVYVGESSVYGGSITLMEIAA